MLSHKERPTTADINPDMNRQEKHGLSFCHCVRCFLTDWGGYLRVFQSQSLSSRRCGHIRTR